VTLKPFVNVIKGFHFKINVFSMMLIIIGMFQISIWEWFLKDHVTLTEDWSNAENSASTSQE